MMQYKYRQQYKVILEVNELKEWNIKNELDLEGNLEHLFQQTNTNIDIVNITKLEKGIQYNYICFVDEDVDFLVTDLKGNEVYNNFNNYFCNVDNIKKEILELFKDNVKFIDISKSDITKKDLPEWCRGIRARYYADLYFKNA